MYTLKGLLKEEENFYFDMIFDKRKGSINTSIKMPLDIIAQGVGMSLEAQGITDIEFQKFLLDVEDAYYKSIIQKGLDGDEEK